MIPPHTKTVKTFAEAVALALDQGMAADEVCKVVAQEFKDAGYLAAAEIMGRAWRLIRE